MNKIPTLCPACTEKLHVEKLQCDGCGTSVAGKFALPVLLHLSLEEQDFLLRFIKSSGSLKEMAKQMGNSYPKVRNTLDDIISHIGELEKKSDAGNN